MSDDGVGRRPGLPMGAAIAPVATARGFPDVVMAWAAAVSLASSVLGTGPPMNLEGEPTIRPAR